MQFIRNIDFSKDPRDFYRYLRIAEDSRHADEFNSLLKQAEAVAVPKAAYTLSNAVHVSEEVVSLSNIRFTSRLLSKNLQGTVYPFAATAGQELAEFSTSLSGTLHRFWMEFIQNMFLYSALSALESGLPQSNLSCMNPGSLPDWGIEQQQELFEHLGDIPSVLGIRLDPNCLIEPLKSVTGIYFYSDVPFCNCSLCDKKNCPSRRSFFQRPSYRMAAI